MITDNAIRQRLLEHFPFLGQGKPALCEAVFRQASWAQLPTGQMICHDGGQCSHLALVVAGRARIYKIGENGREVTLYRVGPGESCVVTASCIISQRPFPAFAVCETEIEAAVVSRADVQRWMAESAAWRDFVFALVAERLAEVFSVLDAVLFQPLDQRLAALLLHRCGWPQRPLAPGETLRVTHQELAAELGSSREVVTRVLRDFEAEGLVRTGRGQIRLLEQSGLEARLSG